jgi:hypothetical protein
MERKISAAAVAVLLVVSLMTGLKPLAAEELLQQDPPAATAQTQREPGFPHILGSIVFTTLFLPVKLLQCVGTQAVAAVAYTGTFGVEGNYDGGTNGKEIGNVARHACTGWWIVRPSQVVRDYGE